jgi:hypothetical protein
MGYLKAEMGGVPRLGALTHCINAITLKITFIRIFRDQKHTLNTISF